MARLKWKPFVELLLLLAILLQGLLPFLHAHTGFSSRSGLHTPDAVISHVQAHSNTNPALTSKSEEESSVVQIGSGLSNEDERLALTHLIGRDVFWSITKPNITSFLASFPSEPNRALLSFYRSEAHPPPSIAPPASQHA